MNNYIDDIKNEILERISNHTINVRMNSNENRIIYCSKGDPFDSFYITTWANHLCISGDLGTYVFCCHFDMFSLFQNDKNELRIDPYYWGDKLQGGNTWGIPLAMEFNSELFCEQVKQAILDSEYDDEHKNKLMESYYVDILELDSRNEGYMVDRLMNCEDVFNDVFGGYYEHNLGTRFKESYIRCITAIVWCINNLGKSN